MTAETLTATEFVVAPKPLHPVIERKRNEHLARLKFLREETGLFSDTGEGSVHQRELEQAELLVQLDKESSS